MATRPQVNTNLGAPEQARVVARPLSSRTNVATVNISKGAQLASALSSVLPSLNGFVEEAKQVYQEDEANRAYDTIQGMTYEQAENAVKTGEMLKTESPWYQAAFEKQFGLTYAAKRKRQIIDEYNNGFDKHNGDVDSFLTNYAAEDRDKFGGSKFIMSGLRQGMDGVLRQVRDDNAQFRSQWTQEKAVENFGVIARTAADTAVDMGSNPMETIGSMYGEHRRSLGLSYEQMDTQVFSLAQQYAAEGNVDMVEQILNYDRVGDDGTKVGSFSKRPKYALDSKRLIETARANRGEANRKANTEAVVGLQERGAAGQLDDADRVQLQTMRDDEQLSQAQHESILRQDNDARVRATGDAYVATQTTAIRGEVLSTVMQGRGYTIQDVDVVNPATGKTTTLSADDMIEEAVNDAMNVMASKNATPQQMAAQLASYGVDANYSVWENAMSNGYQALSESLATVGKDGTAKLPEPAIAGYNTWRSLSDQPRLRDRHVTNADAGNIYRDADALVRLRVPEEDALLRSASIDRKSRSGKAAALPREQIDKIIQASTASDGWFGGSPANVSSVSGWIEDSVRVQVELGVAPKQAVKNGIQAYKDSHTIINGAAINTRSAFIPPNFEESSAVMLESFAEQTGEDADDLTLLPAHDGSNYWVVVSKSNVALPIVVEGRSNRFHISQIQQSAEDAKDAEEAALLEEVNEGVADAQADAAFDAAIQAGPDAEFMQGLDADTAAKKAAEEARIKKNKATNSRLFGR